MSFRFKMEHSEKKAGSNVVLALDLPSDDPHRLLSRSIELLRLVQPYICALKINRQLVLPVGLFDGIQQILKVAKDQGLPVIMDCKINDVGHTNRVIAENYFKAGFDAVIANPFVGWIEGLKPVFEVAKQIRGGVILLVYMSHKGAEEGYGQTVCDPKTGKLVSQHLVFAQKALSWKADGTIVGATYPEKIREVHTIVKERIPIYSPGVGVQGGSIESAIKAGARYLIVGRTITLAENPVEVAKTIKETSHKFSKR